MDVYVVGLAIHPAAASIRNLRLEELAYATARAALDDARVKRSDLDHVTLAACDELDGRSISSMLLAAPSGAYLKDEIRVTDSGLMGLCLGALRVASGRFDLGLAISWSQTSLAPYEDVTRMRAEPFFLRPIGMNAAIADGLFAGAVAARWRIGESEVADAVVRRAAQADRNPRAVAHARPTADQVAGSDIVAHPLRTAHCAPVTDGAVAFVLASRRWVDAHPEHLPLARLRGVDWRIDSYRLDQDRLSGMTIFRQTIDGALRRAGIDAAARLDLIEWEAPTGYHDVAYARAMTEIDDVATSPSGGTWSQNPVFCTGLVNAAEAVLQVAGRAGAVQVAGARLALAHGCHGYAQQGHAVAVFESVPA